MASFTINQLTDNYFFKVPEITDYKKLASDRYFESFSQEHQTVLPMSQEDIISEANRLGI